MFEDFFFLTGETEIHLPFHIYRMMQFLDFSYHKKKRIYSNPIENYDTDNSYGIVYNDRASDKIIYIDFIDTFEALFDV